MITLLSRLIVKMEAPYPCPASHITLRHVLITRHFVQRDALHFDADYLGRPEVSPYRILPNI